MEFFRNDEEVVSVAGFSIENGFGSALVHGSMTFLPDVASLAALKALQERLGDMEKALVQAMDEGLEPLGREIPELETVDNPFL